MCITSAAFAWQPLLYQAYDGTVYYKGKAFHQGLPHDITIKDIQLHNAVFYITTLKHGIFKRNMGDSYWHNITPPDAHMRSIKGFVPYYRSISAFCIDGSDPGILYVATKYSLYRSPDGGIHWIPVALRGLPANSCITALYARGEELLVGTSWNGVYRMAGNRFVPFGKGITQRKYSDSVTFTEEVVSISPEYCITKYTHEVFSYSGGEWKKRYKGNMGLLSGGAIVNGKALVVDKYTLVMLSHAGEHYYELSPIYAQCALLTDGTHYVCVHSARKNNDTIRGLYAGALTSWKVVKELVAVAHRTGHNALVCDIKDDYGYVYVHDETASSIGAVRTGVPAKELCNYLHVHNIKAIARMVVFKDERLYRAFNNAYAIKDAATKTPWKGNPKEYWVDPYSEFVHGYNVSIATQAQKAGFDEIQFDYIRFPTDGPVHRCVYAYKPDNGIYKYEAIADFLRSAKQALTIPVSVDVYGFTVWYEFGQWLGQDIETMTSIVDVLCPMVYPSHYGRKFFDKSIDAESYYAIVIESVLRALMNSQATVRPYLQAFNMLSPGWGYAYIKKQRDACTDAGIGGYIWWNAGRDYGVIK